MATECFQELGEGSLLQRLQGMAIYHLLNQVKSEIIEAIQQKLYLMCTDRLHITFIDKEGVENKFKVAEGDNLLDIAHSNDLEMEGDDII